VGGTVDQVLVLMHDLTVDRTTDGTGQLTSLPWSYVAQLDAGSWYSAEFAGEPVPTLIEALTLVQAHGGQVLLDRKPGQTLPLIAAAFDEVQLPYGDAWTFEASLQQVALVLAALPGIRIIWVPLPGVVFDQAFLDTLAAAGVWGVHVSRPEMFTQEFVDMLHATGLSAFRLLSIQPYAESLDAHLHALTIGVDVIDTSQPDVYRDALALLPPPPPPRPRWGCGLGPELVPALLLVGRARRRASRGGAEARSH
jgi:glycerophosphoryl diester phosphodiesterase